METPHILSLVHSCIEMSMDGNSYLSICIPIYTCRWLVCSCAPLHQKKKNKEKCIKSVLTVHLIDWYVNTKSRIVKGRDWLNHLFFFSWNLYSNWLKPHDIRELLLLRHPIRRYFFRCRLYFIKNTLVVLSAV